MPSGVPVESLRLRFALLQSLNSTLETFFLPLVELRPTPMFTHSIAALLKEAKGQRPGPAESPGRCRGDTPYTPNLTLNMQVVPGAPGHPRSITLCPEKTIMLKKLNLAETSLDYLETSS